MKCGADQFIECNESVEELCVHFKDIEEQFDGHMDYLNGCGSDLYTPTACLLAAFAARMRVILTAATKRLHIT